MKRKGEEYETTGKPKRIAGQLFTGSGTETCQIQRPVPDGT